ncbi:MAG: hypothetical protein R3E97_07775 [Candidatus Eisenbacteria bacterium]
MTRQALVRRIVEVLPTDTTIVEILETVEPDEEVLGPVELKEKGFRIALDDFVYSPAWDDILSTTDIVKVDFLDDSGDASGAGRSHPGRRYPPRGEARDAGSLR